MKRSCGALVSLAGHILRNSAPTQLTRLLSWRMLIQDWPSPNDQHDVCEFGMFIVQRASLCACLGLWQARDAVAPFTVMEACSTTSPILLEVPQHDCMLQDCIAEWHVQETIRGFSQAPQVLTFHLKRFSHHANVVTKSRQSVAFTNTVKFPHFTNHSLSIQNVLYNIQAVVYHHLGDTPRSGHYQTLLHLGDGRWCKRTMGGLES